MCVFNDKEVEMLKKWGNERVAKVWLHNFKKSGQELPNPKDTYKLKEFMRAVYESKRYYKNDEEENESEDSESNSEEDTKKKPKKKSSTKVNIFISLEKNNKKISERRRA